MTKKYIQCESIVGKQNNILRVGINNTISDIMRIKPGDHLRWIIKQDTQIKLQKIPPGEENTILPDIINKTVKVSNNHNRITIPETIRLAANIKKGDTLIWKIEQDNLYSDTVEVMKKIQNKPI